MGSVSALPGSFWLVTAQLAMNDDSLISDDPGTILDSYDSVLRAVPGKVAPAQNPPARPISAPVDEVLYRSPYRWTAPRVVICDDGSLEDGEHVYVRSTKIVIGRTAGDIVIGHDVAMSASHAEIIRQDSGGRQAWFLRDLGSSNGTLARARAVTLKQGTTIVIGSKRYRFEMPATAGPTSGNVDDPGTALLSNMAHHVSSALPVLLETSPTNGAAAARHPIRSTRVTIGRPHVGNDIEIEDLCLAGCHAVVARDVSGTWHMEALPSLNGIWVKIDAVRLTDNCLFQCGEQRFKFRL